MAKTKLSISLIKEGIPINRVLKPDILSLTLANGLILYYKNNQPVSPKWVNSFLKDEYVGLVSFFDLAYRQKANRLLGENFKVPETNTISASDYEVIFAIAKDNLEEGERPDIPFFSKVSFRSVSSRLKHYGFKVSIKGINRTYRDNNNDEGGNEE